MRLERRLLTPADEAKDGDEDFAEAILGHDAREARGEHGGLESGCETGVLDALFERVLRVLVRDIFFLYS